MNRGLAMPLLCSKGDCANERPPYFQDICWRPYHVECTGSLLTSEVKRHRARLVLGWGTAWEDLRVLPASSIQQGQRSRAGEERGWGRRRRREERGGGGGEGEKEEEEEEEEAEAEAEAEAESWPLPLSSASAY